MDRLAEMLEMQRQLQLRINGYDIRYQGPETRIDNITMNVLAAKMELSELLNEVGWKPWATSRHVNQEAAQRELIDVWHFLMNLMLHLNMTADDLYEGYHRKNAVNHERQATGYDGISGKCPQCRRDLADVVLKEIITQHPTPRVDLHCVCGRHIGSRAV